MKKVKLFESFISEANKGKVHKAAKQGSYPAVVVVVQDGKVIHQEPVSTPQVAPATFNVMQEKYPKALIHLEDKTGKRLFSESVDTNEEFDGNVSDFKYEFPIKFEEETGNSSKAIKKIAKKGKGYEVRTSTYMSQAEMEKVGLALGLKLKSYVKDSRISISIYESVITEAKYTKKSLLKAMTQNDGDITTTDGKEYVVYKYSYNRRLNDTIWQDDVVMALDQDGEEWEIKYSDIASYNESVVTEKREDVGKYNTVKKVIKELGRRPSEQELATFINNNYYDVTEVERGDDDSHANDKIADLVAFYKFDIDDWEIAWADAQNESVVTKGKMPTKFIGNDEIVFLKTKENSRGAHYNLYYKGHDIDTGGYSFRSEEELKRFADNYILSNQLYNKLKYEDSKPLPESVVTEEVVYSSSNTKPEAAKKATKEFGKLLPKANKGVEPYVFAVIKTKARNYRLAIKSGSYVAHEFMSGLKGDDILTAADVKKAVANIIKLNPDEFNESVVTEGKFDGIADLVKSLHFEVDPKIAEEKKIELGRKQGEVSRKKQIESAEYSLRRFRKEIKYGDGKNVDVFLPGSYDASASELGNGPHTKAVKPVKWNQRKYDQWLEDMAANGGADNAFDMAQNAKNEPGLIYWVTKEFRGEDPMQRIQWDIEAFAESVVTEIVNLVHVSGEAYLGSGTGELVKTKGKKSLIRWPGPKEEWVDSKLVKLVE